MFVIGLDNDLGLDENISFAENADYDTSSKTDFDDTVDYSEDDTVFTVKRHTDKRVSIERVNSVQRLH